MRFSSDAAAEKRRIQAGNDRRSDIVVVPYAIDEDDPTMLLTPMSQGKGRPWVTVRAREEPVWDLADITEIEPEQGPLPPKRRIQARMKARRLPRLPSLAKPELAPVIERPSAMMVPLLLFASTLLVAGVAYFIGF